MFECFQGINKPLKAIFWLVSWSVCQSVCLSVTKLFLWCSTQFKNILNVFECFYVIHVPLYANFGLSIRPSIYLSIRLSVCPSSVCLPNFSENADARNCDLMTLFIQGSVL